MKKKGVNLIYMVGVGGCGINITATHAKKNTPITTLIGNQVQYRYMDTTTRSAVSNDVDPMGPLFHSVANGGATVDGSGGEQNANAELYRPAAQAFIKNEKLNKDSFVNIITSVSGGTGSRLTVVLLDELLKKGIPVCVIAVGDVKHLRHSNATVDALKRLDYVCNLNDSSALLFYNENGVGMNKVDREIVDCIDNMLCYLCGDTTIDHADMRRLYMPTSYITMDRLPSRLYLASINGAYLDYSDKLVYELISDEEQPVVAMSLTIGSEDVVLPQCYATKTGSTKNSVVINTLNLKQGVNHTIFNTLKLTQLIKSIEEKGGFNMPKPEFITYDNIGVDF